jgi:hypothetical protein
MDYKAIRKKGRPLKVGKRIVGEIFGQCLRKHVRQSIDMHPDPQGWKWEIKALEDAVIARVTYTVLFDDETGSMFSAPISDFWKFGFRVDEGFRKEIVLPLQYWEVTPSLFDWNPK